MPASETFLKNYCDLDLSTPEQNIFPLRSNQKMNEYLKEIADLCKSNKKLTYHIARHTFAPTITHLNNVPIETVSKKLAHEKITTT